MKDLIDNKYKRKAGKEQLRQKRYDSYESKCNHDALRKFRAQPYQLSCAERMNADGDVRR